MNNAKKIKLNNGFSFIELIVGASIISIVLVVILNVYGLLVQAEINSAKLAKASYLLEEGAEAARYLRDKGWTANISGLSTTTRYYLFLSTLSGVGEWQATTTKQISENIFERYLLISDVYRSDSTKDISEIGTFDSNTKKITVSVTWFDGHSTTTTKSLSTYLTNMNKN